MTMISGGRALNELGADEVTELYQTANAAESVAGSQTVRDKFHSREGNSPDLQLRSQIYAKWETMWRCKNNQDVGLEAATH